MFCMVLVPYVSYKPRGHETIWEILTLRQFDQTKQVILRKFDWRKFVQTKQVIYKKYWFSVISFSIIPEAQSA